jgi:acylphosphatase
MSDKVPLFLEHNCADGPNFLIFSQATDQDILFLSRCSNRTILMRRSYRIIVKGKVQGVNYRFNAQAIAHKHDLTGFAKNLHDGSVMIHAEGDEEGIHRFIEWCHTGPRLADVTEVNAQEQEIQGYQTFEIRR